MRDAQALRLVACVRIEHVALALGAQKALVCVLTVDVDKMIADFPKLGCVDGRSIDVCPAAPLRIDHAPQDQFVVGLQVVCREPVGDRRRAVKNGRDFRARCALAQNC